MRASKEEDVAAVHTQYCIRKDWKISLFQNLINAIYFFSIWAFIIFEHQTLGMGVYSSMGVY